MKRGLGLILAIIFMSIPVANAYEAESSYKDLRSEFEALISEQLSNINTNEWEPYLSYIEDEGSFITKDQTPLGIISGLLTGKLSFSAEDLLKEILAGLVKSLTANFSLLAKIIVIAIICSLFSNLKGSFASDSIGEIGYFVCYSSAMILIVQNLIKIISVASDGIEKMVGFMQILYPLLIGLLAALGNLTKSTILQPSVGILIASVSTLLKNIMLPLISTTAVVILINHLGEEEKLKKLSSLLKNSCIWIITGTFTIFLGVLTIQGVMSSSFDSLSIRTAKFAIDSFVPIMGKLFSQSVDTVIGCSLLVKNAVGVSGLLIIGLIALVPALKILALLVTFKLSSALIEPISDKRLVECLNNMGNLLVVLFITVVGIAILFYMTISLIIGSGNIISA